MKETKIHKFFIESLKPTKNCCGVDLDHEECMRRICADFVAYLYDNGWKMVEIRPMPTPEHRLFLKKDLSSDNEIKITALDFEAMFNAYNDELQQDQIKSII